MDVTGQTPVDDGERAESSSESPVIVDDAQPTSGLGDPLIDGAQATSTTPAPWTVSAVVQDQVCYALAVNRHPIIHSLKITGVAPTSSGQLTVSVSSAWGREGRPPLIEASFTVDAPKPNQLVELSPVSSVKLDDIAMAELETASDAELTITVTDGTHEISQRHEFRVFARTQWINSRGIRELTAAFVQPNHPDVTDILSAASDRLRRAGLDPSMSGYQQAASGQQHRIAQAIYEELSSRIDTYINPPDDFNSLGQLLMPLDQVLAERKGTCIDLACAYASCIERAGLHPVIVMIMGHAFPGYFANEVHASRAYVDTWGEVVNLVDSQLLVSMESTLMPLDASWEQALAQGRANINEATMEGLIDVRLAHLEGVRSLPSRVIRNGELLVVIDNGPSKPPVIERRDPITRKLLPDVVPARVQQWKNTLLDLSFRNRLLNLTTTRTGLRLLPPVNLLGHLEDLMANGDAVQVIPADLLNAVQMGSIPEGKQRIAQNLNDEFFSEALNHGRTLFSTLDSGTFKTRARRLISDARVAEEDGGANNLYLTIGSVQWGDAYGDFHSPVFLVPLRMALARGDRGLVMKADEQQSTVPNYCLIEALRAREQLSLAWFGDDMSDEFGLDVDKGLNELRREFRERGLDAKGFIVNPSASIALLDFKKFRLWKDLNDHWKDFAKSPLVKHLIETPRLNFVDAAAATPAPAVTDTSILTPQPADGSQTRAIVRALAGHSFVLEGPPGTGKSQTITNMLANAMRTGKRVLFVAEKQAALGVVHERLQAVGLGPYCLELHDRGTTPDALRQQMRTALEQNPTLDQRGFDMLEQDFAVAAGQLDQYRRGLHEPGEAGFSFATAYEELTQLGAGPVAVVPREAMKVGFERLEGLRRSLLDVDDLASVARVRPDHPWMLARGVQFEQLDRARLAEIVNGVRSVVGPLKAADEGFAALLASPTSLEELRQLASLLAVQTLCGPAVNSDLARVLAANWNTEFASALETLTTALTELGAEFAGHEAEVLRTDLRARATAVAEAADSGFLGLGKKGRVQKQLGDLAQVIGHKDDPAAATRRMDMLARLSDTVRTAWTTIGGLAASGALGDRVPLTSDDLVGLRQRADRVREAANAAAIGGRFGEAVRTWMATGRPVPPSMAEQVELLSAHLEALAGLMDATTESLQAWAGDRGVVAAAVQSCDGAWAQDVNNGTYLELQRWLRLQLLLQALRELSMTDFCQKLERGEVAGRDAPDAFERGLLMTTMQMQAEALNLDVFDRGLHDQRVNRFIDLMTRRSVVAREVIPFELSRSRKVAGNVDVGRVGEFRRYVSAPGRRRSKSVRHLISTYPEIVSDLTPCFLMSPDSVAQFVPPGTVEFDIAVFDEASQITVADAIGVMGRARSVVIVGDSKQMPPTRVGVFGGNEDDAPVELGEDFVEEESILEEVLQAGFDQEWLTWHYRSQDESLITFSNDHYYESRLASFPAPQRLRDGCGLRYRRVEGQFDHGGTRTNALEAQAIIDELLVRLDDPAYEGQTFGVITLNMQQRRLVESMLDDHAHPVIRAMRETEDPEQRLFVLNLENVQGRERDVILLGTSFSKRSNGSAMPMNFGPLTQRGGEKRLNVAITRARRQLVVVSSFDPEEMRDPNSLGMIHLKTFLERARDLNRAADDEPVQSSHATSRFVGELADRLRAEGLRVITGYGRSQFKVDLAISDDAHPDEWLVAVLVDGSDWASRPLASDRDALPAVILRNIMGWQRVVRVWLAAWRLEPDQIVTDLVDMVARASQERDQGPPPPPPTVTTTPPPPPPPTVTTTPPPSGAGFRGAEPFVRFADQNLAHLKDVLATLPPQAQDVMRRLVTTEAPMFRDVALKRVANMFGVGRVSAKMLDALQPLATGFPSTDLGQGVVLWSPERQAATWRGFRPGPKEQRELFEVVPEELINAMVSIAQMSMGIGADDLVRASAQLFGVSSVTNKAKEHVQPALDHALRTGRLVEDDGHLMPG